MLHKWSCAARISGRWQRLRPFTSGYEHLFADMIWWCDSNAVKANRRGLSSRVVVRQQAADSPFVQRQVT